MNRIDHINEGSYRPDIDGLRAIAVIAVILFHASPTFLPGGFAGVDVFFVISGYLITGLVYRELESGSFSFIEFYKRRVKRILPAYIVVSLFTLVVATYLLIPNDYIFYTTSLAASWGFSSNVFFSMLSWGYFGQRTEEFPLLHTWSLSVEEQFYFVFPIILILLYRHYRRYITDILVIAALAFIFLSEWKTGKVGTYFLLPYRAHELLLGALTYLYLRNTERQHLSYGIANVMSITGAAMLFGSLFLLKRSTAYPGFHSLYPCMGTALIIYAGNTPNIIKSMLQSKVLVGIGLLSYSLYLWHWPLFSFARYRQIDITFGIGTLIIVLTFVLSYLTWKYIEVPVRTNRLQPFRSSAIRYYLAPAIVFITVGALSYATEGMPQRFPEDIRQLISSYSFERDLTHACSIRSNEYQGVTLDYLTGHCAFGDKKDPKADVLLFGDSHANHFKPFVEKLSEAAEMKGVYYVEGSCTASDLFGGQITKSSEPTVCQRRNADLLKMAGSFKYVVIASFWPYQGNEKGFESDLENVVKSISASGAIPVIFKDNPYYSRDLSQCILFKKRGWISMDTNCNIPYSYVNETQVSMNKVIDSIQGKYPYVIVIDPKSVMCNDKECATYIGNIALYKDANHINSKAAALLAEQYLATKGNPFNHSKF
jgi:peptidoglycan/LPS O-acetylase OafA/YrhL